MAEPGYLTYYHEELEPPHNLCQVPDPHDGRISFEAMQKASGGKSHLVEEPEAETPGVAPTPAQFEQVKPKAKASSARAKDDKGE